MRKVRLPDGARSPPFMLANSLLVWRRKSHMVNRSGRNLVNRAICRLDLVHSPKSQRSCTRFSLPESRHGQSSGTDWRTDFRPATKSVPIILKVP
ncbi:hypothetical protein BDQ94DRAFT_145821 [Aspergillus welwitschiae]|uniref:Uncharacterized protein n=1 Tax=Aspergillus welwitschiae TaxID=1341132 RepID=A0A3F3PZB8_9EURO|nr:hypothetical protein BDQ94DRAFT_145821 [Aspergillus welwitschiae]RDH32293.1 hypothetical protein BDQ94DRAFT_145821 [Aspergillus welwitschiae]